VPAGSYKVGILPGRGRSENNFFDRKVDLPKKGGPTIGATQYADPKTSGLTAQISKDGPNEPVFDLK
jgi:hypothetical protein